MSMPIETRCARLLLALTLLSGCSGTGPLGELFEPRTPWEEYRDSLEAARLELTSAGQAWLVAGQQAVADAPGVELPHREIVHFDPLRPAAGAWRLALDRGQELLVRVSGPESGERGLFVDLLRADAGGADAVASLHDGEELRYRVEKNGRYVLRVQPELLTGGQWTVSIGSEASLTFPVAGRDRSAIGGRFGDPRDGGRRSHEGVDIFAPRGTKALAAAEGRVVRVGENRLGGKTVWLETVGSLGLYYAHLDRQSVRSGERVRAGQAVGRVGNTGNAAGTPPHLHFAIYDGGPVDPLPFITSGGSEPPAVTSDLALLGRWARVTSGRLNLREAPTTAADVRGQAERHEALRVAGASADWYRVESAARTGYVTSRLVEAADSPVGHVRLDSAAALLHEPAPGAAVVAEVAPGESVEILARRPGHVLVRRSAADDRPAWLATDRLP